MNSRMSRYRVVIPVWTELMASSTCHPPLSMETNLYEKRSSSRMACLLISLSPVSISRVDGFTTIWWNRSRRRKCSMTGIGWVVCSFPSVSSVCKCPEMTAGPHYTYFWTDFNGSSPTPVGMAMLLDGRCLQISISQRFSNPSVMYFGVHPTTNVPMVCSQTISCICAAPSSRSCFEFTRTCITIISLYRWGAFVKE